MRQIFILAIVLFLGSAPYASASAQSDDFVKCFDYVNRVSNADPSYSQTFCDAHASQYWTPILTAMDEDIYLWNKVSIDTRSDAKNNMYRFYVVETAQAAWINEQFGQSLSPSSPKRTDVEGEGAWNLFEKDSIKDIYQALERVWHIDLEPNAFTQFLGFVEKDVQIYTSKSKSAALSEIQARARVIPICAANLFYSKLSAAIKETHLKPMVFEEKWNKGERISSTKFGSVVTLLESAKICSEVGPELVNCGVNYVQNQKEGSVGNIKDYLRICTQRLGIKGNPSKYGIVSAGVSNGQLNTPNLSFTEAWSTLKEKDENSLESIQAVKTILGQLKLEWDSVSKSNPGAYNDLNRQMVPLFIFTKTEINNLPLATLLKFKIDFLNNFNSVFGNSEKQSFFGGQKVAARNEARDRIRFIISDF